MEKLKCYVLPLHKIYRKMLCSSSSYLAGCYWQFPRLLPETVLCSDRTSLENDREDARCDVQHLFRNPLCLCSWLSHSPPILMWHQQVRPRWCSLKLLPIDIWSTLRLLKPGALLQLGNVILLVSSLAHEKVLSTIVDNRSNKPTWLKATCGASEPCFSEPT